MSLELVYTADDADELSPPPDPPEGLRSAGLKLWNDVVNGWELPPSDLETLASACRLRDTVDELRSAFAADPRYLVKGSMGQDVLNGLVVEIRQTEKTMSDLLGKLRLSLPDDDDDLTRGRPMTRSEVGRKGSGVRWGKGPYGGR